MRSGLNILTLAFVIIISFALISVPAPKKKAKPDSAVKSVKTEVFEKSLGGITLVYIPAGTFTMGRDSKGKDYSPSRGVKLTGGFWIAKYEITQSQYEEVTGVNPCKESRYGEGGALPVFNVSWYDAVEFCNGLSEKHGLKPYYRINKSEIDSSNISEYDNLKWIVTTDKTADGFRLPTEAQWEYACNGTKRSSFYWGENQTWDGSGAYAWHMFNSGKRNYSKGRFWWVKYHKVKKPGQKRPNAFGIYDMSGNVAEWCYDRYSGSYQSADKTDPYGGEGDFRYRVARGGSMLDAPADLTVYKRWPFKPFERTGTNGIRVVLPE